MKKQLKKVFSVMALCVAMMISVTACGKSEPTEKAEVTITFMNGDAALGSVTAVAGEVLTGYERYESQEGFEFLGWFETPTFLETSKVDLATVTYEEDKTLYGSFKNTQVAEDTRPWSIVGTGKGEALALSNWNNACEDDLVTFKLTGNATNEFAITVDLFAGDQFQVIHDHDWNDQRGYGWFTEIDATQFENGGGLGGSDKTSNVNVIMDGNYTITLTTDPENSLQDTMVIVRNGDPVAEPISAEEAEEEPYIVSDKTQIVVKGSWVSDWSENKELTRADGTNLYSITMDLEAGTELYFMVWDDGTDTGLGLKYENVTEASKAVLAEAYNVQVKDAGSYTFTVDADAMTIDVTK
ncbi:MAG: hypothetical protein IJX86_12135 [Lachnospiraceae bacterium]|nr:hypothetical protein [Lachnospiraceae bacterium]